MKFINADDPNIIYSNPYEVMSILAYDYCQGNPVMFVDYVGCWAQNYSGFRWTRNGFNLYVKVAFLSRSFCLLYAADIIHMRGEWHWWGKGYKNMSALRIAQELWFHALVYYFASPIKSALNKLGVSWNWINSKIKSAKYMEINNDDKRAGVYSLIWWNGFYVKNFILLRMGMSSLYKYIIV